MANCYLCGQSDKVTEIEFEVSRGRFECVDDWDCDAEIEAQNDVSIVIDEVEGLEMPSYAS